MYRIVRIISPWCIISPPRLTFLYRYRMLIEGIFVYKLSTYYKPTPLFRADVRDRPWAYNTYYTVVPHTNNLTPLQQLRCQWAYKTTWGIYYKSYSTLTLTFAPSSRKMWASFNLPSSDAWRRPSWAWKWPSIDKLYYVQFILKSLWLFPNQYYNISRIFLVTMGPWIGRCHLRINGWVPLLSCTSPPLWCPCSFPCSVPLGKP